MRKSLALLAFVAALPLSFSSPVWAADSTLSSGHSGGVVSGATLMSGGEFALSAASIGSAPFVVSTGGEFALKAGSLTSLLSSALAANSRIPLVPAVSYLGMFAIVCGLAGVWLLNTRRGRVAHD